MKRNIFAVCDLEVDYALNFMDYMNRKKNIPFEIQAFTSVENLIAYGKQTHIELLLISGRAMCREVRDLDIGKIIILSEGVHPPELDQYPSVYKYQSSSDVLREVMACYGAEKKTVADQIAVIKKDNRNYWNIFTSGTLSENLFCIDTWTDTCQRTSRSLSEYGRIFWI